MFYEMKLEHFLIYRRILLVVFVRSIWKPVASENRSYMYTRYKYIKSADI